MANGRYKVEYAETALENLRRFRNAKLTKSFAKSCGWNTDCMATSSGCKTPTPDFGCAWVIIGFYLT
jgi:hypothetical protein